MSETQHYLYSCTKRMLCTNTQGHEKQLKKYIFSLGHFKVFPTYSTDNYSETKWKLVGYVQ